jgi:hypothetical protein
MQEGDRNVGVDGESREREYAEKHPSGRNRCQMGRRADVSQVFLDDYVSRGLVVEKDEAEWRKEKRRQRMA